MLLLWHATPDRNLLSIADSGLLTLFATGRMRAVWLHTFSMRQPVKVRIAQRYGLELFQVSLVGVKIPRTRIRRFSRGLWYTLEDVDPLHLVLPFDSGAQIKLYAECPW